MEDDDVIALRAKLNELKRKTWLPVTSEGDGPTTGSKFAGIPWVSQEHPWPACPRCNEPMALFLQLDLATIPKETGIEPRDILMQMFYCISRAECATNGEGCFDPFSPYQVLRLVSPVPDEQVAPLPVLADRIPARSITAWKETDDFPHRFECADYSIDLDDEEIDVFDGEYPRQGDKLAGWPAWVQNVDYPRCRQCGLWMRFVFQIDSQCNLWHMFGDNGCGHITQCQDHRDELAFVWACF